ncbi:hypothetical protein [Aquimarina algicola]|nr:hypothetical protein [Aquimarina algicola]
MKPDKGSNTLNIIFGAFLVVSIIRTGVAIYDWREKKKSEKKCNCAKKG